MKKQVIAGAIILGLGAVTFALARQEARPPMPQRMTLDPPPAQWPDKPRVDRFALYDKVARLRAEVEVLQLEHDLAKERLSACLTKRAESEENATPQVARDYMRIGAEIVGKGTEFESAMQEKGDEIWKAFQTAVGTPSPADLDHLKQDFLRIANELNRKKIDLVVLETRLDGSM